MDLVVFEEAKSLIWEALQEGDFDYEGSVRLLFDEHDHPLGREQYKVAGTGVMKRLILDRGFLDGKAISTELVGFVFNPHFPLDLRSKDVAGSFSV